MHNLESIRFCEILKILVRRTSFEMLVTPSCTWFSSPSQSSDDSKIFLRSFDQVITDMSLSNPVSDWYYRISTKGQILGGMTKFPQKNVLIWNRPPRLMGFTSLWQIQHILPQSSSCFDLIFIDQPNLVFESGVHFSFHTNCHHQITHCKLNLKIPPSICARNLDLKKSLCDCS